MKLVFLALAEQDIERIADYIAQDNPRRSLTFVRELRDQCRKITRAPRAYQPRSELAHGLRSCSHGNYLIFFTADDHVVKIVRVLHGAMNIESVFQKTVLR